MWDKEKILAALDRDYSWTKNEISVEAVIDEWAIVNTDTCGPGIVHVCLDSHLGFPYLEGMERATTCNSFNCRKKIPSHIFEHDMWNFLMFRYNAQNL